ncbi:hypothetical protein J6590_042216 [Homalodisca vitripennis]|nr:hypothetical protein J6590_042216 [Homalodisca vitripennis]
MGVNPCGLTTWRYILVSLSPSPRLTWISFLSHPALGVNNVTVDEVLAGDADMDIKGWEGGAGVNDKCGPFPGKHGNLKLKHGSSDTSFDKAHLVELNATNRISKGLSNQKWRVVLGTHCEVHYALPFLTGSSYSDAVGGVSLYYPMCFH